MFSNELSPAEVERLALLLEELGEAQQMVGKILRHGYESINPLNPADDTNRARLENELGDVLVAIDFLLEYDDIKQWRLDDRKRVKHHKIWNWLHHQDRQTRP
jgi:NTP pyrophosphatase (non-canonical NTP hydrolase)